MSEFNHVEIVGQVKSPHVWEALSTILYIEIIVKGNVMNLKIL